MNLRWHVWLRFFEVMRWVVVIEVALIALFGRRELLP